jgi:putative DNA primase/helicase
VTDPSAPVPATSTTGAAFRDDDLPGQTRFAGIFAVSRSELFCYVHGIGWHKWDKSHWRFTKKGEAQRSVVKMLHHMHNQAFGNQARVQEIAKMSSHSAHQGILSIASVLPEMAVGADEIDVDPYLLNCANGTLDLRTMELKDHDSSDRLTKVTRAAYDPAADQSQWLAFLERVLPDDNVRHFLQRYIGVALLGIVREHVLPIATGVGANGKSTFINGMLYALGDYGHEAEQDLFMRAKANPNGAAPAILSLMGRRYVVTQETEVGAPLATALMKTLTGGDQITARGLYQPVPITFTPSHSAMIVTNHLPKVPANDDALWRRLVVIPFDVVIPPAERNPQLSEQLQLSADGILAWAVEGYLDYLKQGLNPPTPVTSATAAYRNNSDDVTQFLADTCTADANARVTRKSLWPAWQAWANAAGVAHGQQRALYERLTHLGYAEFKTSQDRGFLGLRLDSDVDEDVFVDPTDPKE